MKYITYDHITSDRATRKAMYLASRPRSEKRKGAKLIHLPGGLFHHICSRVSIPSKYNPFFKTWAVAAVKAKRSLAES